MRGESGALSRHLKLNKLARAGEHEIPVHACFAVLKIIEVEHWLASINPAAYCRHRINQRIADNVTAFISLSTASFNATQAP